MIPSLTNTGDFQEFREAQTGKDSEEQLVWKGVPRNTLEGKKKKKRIVFLLPFFPPIKCTELFPALKDIQHVT